MCVTCFAAYLGKLKLFIPYILIAVDIFFGLVGGIISNSGFFGVLNLAAAIFAILCVMGVVNFRLNFDAERDLKCKASHPCIIAAAIFIVLGIIALIRCCTYLSYGLSFLYLIDTICFFGGAALGLFASEAESVYTEGTGYQYYQNTAGNGAENSQQHGGTTGSTQNQQYSGAAAGGQTPNGIPVELVRDENIVLNVVLSFITFGIYLFIWWYRICKRIRLMNEDNPACGGELACIIFVPFYSLYWFYTRGQRLVNGAKRHNIFIKENSVLYLILALFGLSIVSLILIQTELNTMADKLRRGVKDDMRQYGYGYSYEYAPYEGQQGAASGKAEDAESIRGEKKETAEEKEETGKPEAAPEQAAAKADTNSDEIIETLKKLSDLKDQGILSEEEFAAKKAELLGRM